MSIELDQRLAHSDPPPSWDKRFGFILIASFVAPVLLLWQAWKSTSFKYKHYLLTAFITIYGATINIYYDPTGFGGDGVRHLLLVYTHYVGLSFDQFLVELWHTLTFQISTDPGIRDPYKHIISYLTGGVLGWPWLFFTVVAFVYGYFFSGSMLLIFQHLHRSRLNYVLVAFVALLFLTKNIEGVNTVRTWTGLWVLVYACLRYYEKKDWRYIVLMLMPPFIHVGYFIMVIPAVIVLVFGSRPLLYATLFVASSSVNLIPQERFMEAMTVTERSQSQAQSYFREQRIDREAAFQRMRAQEYRWYKAAQSLGLHRWALNFLVYTLLLSGIAFCCMNYLQKQIFSIGLLTVTLSNATWFIFALSNRSWVVGSIFILAAFVMLNTDPESRAKVRARVTSH